MSELREPARWLESGALSPEIRRDLIAYANVAPGSERRARMLSELERQLDVSSPASGGSLLSSGPLKLVAAIAAACGTLAIVVALLTSPPPVRTPAVEVLPPVAVKPAVAAPAEPATPVLAAAQVAEPEKSEAPARVAKVRRRRTVRGKVAAAPATSVASASHDRESVTAAPVDASGALSELMVLARARRALLAHPQRALAFVDEHARRFPHGTFEEEREVLAIESLLKLAQTSQAKQRARAFARRFPQSAHRAHLEELVSKD